MQTIINALETFKNHITQCTKSCLKKNGAPYSNLSAFFSRIPLFDQHGGESDHKQITAFNTALQAQSASFKETEQLLTFAIDYIKKANLSTYIENYIWTACIEAAGFTKDHIDYLAEKAAYEINNSEALTCAVYNDSECQEQARSRIQAALSFDLGKYLLNDIKEKYFKDKKEIELTPF